MNTTTTRTRLSALALCATAMVSAGCSGGTDTDEGARADTGNETPGTEAASAEAAPAEVGEATELDGAFRADFDEVDLAAQGVPANDIGVWAGLITLTLRDGDMVMHSHAELWPDCPGDYAVTDSELTLEFDAGAPQCGPVTFQFGWTLDSDELSLDLVSASIPEGEWETQRMIWGSLPWTKID